MTFSGASPILTEKRAKQVLRSRRQDRPSKPGFPDEPMWDIECSSLFYTVGPCFDSPLLSEQLTDVTAIPACITAEWIRAELLQLKKWSPARPLGFTWEPRASGSSPHLKADLDPKAG
ncbi:hypothetical protein J1605_009083 [Eschrichtius robustus]|uniref:Uncharacterized protein n=1 Tax=Eschrichtius robustus TaxID=9764 RepID=A0AB34GZH0_ESCRO|nr:hypothetical protein J1605_009083 [Eschrichtius robustus]